MNTVAAVFVLDIDDYAFRFFTTRVVRNILTSLPPLGMLREDEYTDDVDVGATKMGADDFVWQLLGGWILGPALLALATGLYQGWCGDNDLVLAVWCVLRRVKPKFPLACADDVEDASGGDGDSFFGLGFLFATCIKRRTRTF